MAVYIARALVGGDAGVPTGPATATFTDVPTDHWAFKYVEYAVEAGVVGGYGNGTYRPVLIVDRGQMAVFVARAMVRGRRLCARRPDHRVLPGCADRLLGLQVRGVLPRAGGSGRLRRRDLSADTGGNAGCDGGVRAEGVCVADVGPFSGGLIEPARRP